MSTKTTLRKKETLNEDLLRERQKCTFNPEELTNFLDGGAEKTEERRDRENFFLTDPELEDKVPSEYLSHKEKYELAVKKSCIIFKKVQELQNAGQGGMESYRQILGGLLGSAILKDGNPFSLHYVMFIPTLMGQGTVEQQAEWIQRAWSCNIIGTYAQTELGHGTFIRGLETTATYDPKTQEFILNSPTLTAFKWWPGGLAHTANYAVVVAQLYTKGQCHGIHPFIVQLRDEETHMPLPGIKIGEIGVKLGMNTTNNGYLGFDNVRIPRKNMLMKNSQVLEDGTYVQSPSSKLTYGTMMFVRVVLVYDMANYLSKAVTIAVRYSAIRRQSQPKPDEPEPQVLDYVTQQYKIFPHLASIFAFKFSANWLWDMYNNVSSELEKGDLDRLPELHAISCCLKAVCTADAASGVEMCRLSCGGHGFMSSSNLPQTYGLVTAACTYEGENTVLLLQTARYLMKVWPRVLAKQSLTPTMNYLREAYARRGSYIFINTVPGIIEGLKLVAAEKIRLSYEHMDKRMRQGLSSEDAWNETSIQLVAAAEAHCRLFLVEKFYESVRASVEQLSAPLHRVLTQICELYAVNTALKNLGDLIRFATIDGEAVDELQNWLESTLRQIRPNAVGIVDGFDLHDRILSSALGAYDGQVYERLYNEALKSPLNQEPVNQSFHLYLKPFLKSNL